MTGRFAVHGMRNRLDATFERASGIQGDAELLSDFARHLCVLVSGFLEQAVIELTMEHVRRQASPSIQRYAADRLRSFRNANTQKLLKLLGSFDEGWFQDLERYIVDERKDAVDSVTNLRNAISHGRFAGVTISRVRAYYKEVNLVVDHIAGLCAP